jgi:ABC-type phosphate transport system substrate-binding protein
MNRKITFALGVGALSLFTGLATVHADPPPGTGWDKNPDVAVGGGSDTTYLVSQRLEALYNGAPGCTIDTGTTSVNKGKCADTSAAPTGATNGNYDHDILVSATPTGSSAGVNALLPTGAQYTPAIDFARSSRGPSGTESGSTTFWGYARDGIAVVTFGSRSGLSLTKQQLINIYTCAVTDWSQLGQPAGPIIAWDMNTASGTRASFLTYLGIGGAGQPALGSCVRKLNPVGGAAAVGPFENDVKPILADSGPDLTLGTADDNENNYVWWMSYGNWTTYPYTANGTVNGTAGGTPITSNLVTVDGQSPSAASIFNSTYTIMRTLFQVTRNTDADCRQAPGSAGACDNVGATVYGSSLGKGGAVREFTQWLCRTSNAQQAVNPVTGRGYRTEVVGALNAEGFQQLSATVTGLRTAGYACQVLT